ncbi:hypothetical protein QO010_001470 [Caulobacter ginsengisoli]|uniref:Cyclic nucleotide-binding domain-containing protein n=1 Tax=Caulobacter ginsengisoli TaxID=400775 RepID=A0ABU0IP08_9CAUL|nr:hypothetical protein [Caulobacter ginsengisoli]MDQ0463699.1 hypothetical protein [Caulobacter ginsengisoli]
MGYRRLAAIALVVLFGLTPLASAHAEADLAALMKACNDLSRRAPDIEKLAQAQSLTAWTPEEMAAVEPITVVEPLRKDRDKPQPDLPTRALRSDTVRAWWLDAGHSQSLVYQEADQPQMGGGDLIFISARRWRSCQIAGQIGDARPLVATIYDLDADPLPGLFQESRSLSMSVSSETLPGTSDWFDMGANLFLYFDTMLALPGITSESFYLAVSDRDEPDPDSPVLRVSKATLFKAIARPARFVFSRETDLPN